MTETTINREVGAERVGLFDKARIEIQKNYGVRSDDLVCVVGTTTYFELCVGLYHLAGRSPSMPLTELYGIKISVNPFEENCMTMMPIDPHLSLGIASTIAMKKAKQE